MTGMQGNQATGGDEQIGADQEMGGHGAMGEHDMGGNVGATGRESDDVDPELTGDYLADRDPEGVDDDMTGDEKSDARLEEQLPRNPSADEPAPGIP